MLQMTQAPFGKSFQLFKESERRKKDRKNYEKMNERKKTYLLCINSVALKILGRSRKLKNLRFNETYLKMAPRCFVIIQLI